MSEELREARRKLAELRGARDYAPFPGFLNEEIAEREKRIANAEAQLAWFAEKKAEIEALITDKRASFQTASWTVTGQRIADGEDFVSAADRFKRLEQQYNTNPSQLLHAWRHSLINAGLIEDRASAMAIDLRPYQPPGLEEERKRAWARRQAYDRAMDAIRAAVMEHDTRKPTGKRQGGYAWQTGARGVLDRVRKTEGYEATLIGFVRELANVDLLPGKFSRGGPAERFVHDLYGDPAVEGGPSAFQAKLTELGERVRAHVADALKFSWAWRNALGLLETIPATDEGLRAFEGELIKRDLLPKGAADES